MPRAECVPESAGPHRRVLHVVPAVSGSVPWGRAASAPMPRAHGVCGSLPPQDPRRLLQCRGGAQASSAQCADWRTHSALGGVAAWEGPCRARDGSCVLAASLQQRGEHAVCALRSAGVGGVDGVGGVAALCLYSYVFPFREITPRGFSCASVVAWWSCAPRWASRRRTVLRLGLAQCVRAPAFG